MTEPLSTRRRNRVERSLNPAIDKRDSALPPRRERTK
jgi:hypothetical protein